MRKQSLPKRMVSAACAVALASTICPLAAQSAFADEAVATAAGTQISVTAPFYVDFTSQAAPYDVAQPKSNLEATSYFMNTGQDALQVTNIKCEKPAWEAGKDVLIKEAGAADLELQSSLFSINLPNNNNRTVPFTYGTNLKETDIDGYFNNSSFGMEAGERVNLTYKLDLTNANINPAVADGAANRQSLGTVTYTFSTLDFYVKVTGGSTNVGDLYDADQVKAQADKISANDATLKNMYDAFITSDVNGNANYNCKTKWGGTWYDVRVIGINHDDKTSGGNAGLTFQFKDSIGSFAMNQENSSIDGWAKSQLRANMNPGISTGSDIHNGATDTNQIWNLVPETLSAVIAPVNKSTVNQPNGISEDSSVSSDNLFILSFVEYVTVSNNSDFYAKEGTQYLYWERLLGTDLTFTSSCKGRATGDPHVCPPDHDLLCAGLLLPSQSNLPYEQRSQQWIRSIRPSNADGATFNCIAPNGNPRTGSIATAKNLVRPAFCL